ncbi:MAG: succinylglutamate desuccinylase/aspartoacylase family protein [Balneolaceae bacterium]
MEFAKLEISDVEKIDFSDRVIGEIIGEEEGPTIIAMAAIHGNEPSGIGAVCRVLKKIEKSEAHFKGRFIGLIGNMEALEKRQRYIDEDMNRIWSTSILDKIRRTPTPDLQTTERKEIKKLLEIIDPITSNDEANHPLIFADLHTFSSESGIFALTSRREENIELMVPLGVPLVFGIEHALQGTVSKYIQDSGEIGFSFEAGQHFSSQSENNASAGLLCLLVAAGCIQASKIEDFTHYYDYLKNQTESLPRKVEYVYKHIIEPGDDFKMRLGFKNFDAVKKGDWLATDQHGKVSAQQDGYILMPLYQQQGEDGFFIVQDCN